MEDTKMADKINVLIPEETVDAKIKEIGEQISKDYAGKEVHLICILKGGVFFVSQTNIDPSCIGSFLQHIYRIAQDLSYPECPGY